MSYLHNTTVYIYNWSSRAATTVDSDRRLGPHFVLVSVTTVWVVTIFT